MRIDPRKRCWPSRARAIGPRGSVRPTRTRVSQSSAARRAAVAVPEAAKNSSVAASNNKLSERATTRSNVESGSSTRAACFVCAAHPASIAPASGASHCAVGAGFCAELFLLREEASLRVDRGSRILTTAVCGSATTKAPSRQLAAEVLVPSGCSSSAFARRVATVPSSPTTLRATDLESTAATAPSTEITEPAEPSDVIDPIPSNRYGRIVSASATGTAVKFSISTITAESSQRLPSETAEVARTPKTRWIMSPPGTRIAVSRTGESPIRRWRTAASMLGWCQRSSAPIHQSRHQVSPRICTKPAGSQSAIAPASTVPRGAQLRTILESFAAALDSA
ncbi:unannotated protein [freshwater metagenome]|uniref:Unannotated protein n=1 Tax=freshwater metagenome TaxID=449393 RepID=A0A6J7U322_9ZZZZ